jgi:hypothetical protein
MYDKRTFCPKISSKIWIRLDRVELQYPSPVRKHLLDLRYNFVSIKVIITQVIFLSSCLNDMRYAKYLQF